MMPENLTNPELDTQAIEPSPNWGFSSAPATVVACVVAIIIFAGVSSLGPDPSWSQVGRWGYLPAERIWDGASWALISTAFVHFQLWHLGFNLYWLWRLGRPVERWAGSIKWVAFILGAAAVSSTAQLVMSDDTGIGASGIVYALFGLLWRGQGVIPEADTLVDRNTVAVFLVWLVAAAIATHIGTANIGNAAHAAGLLFGILVAEWRIRRVRPRLAALATISLGVLTLVGTRVSPWSRRWWELVGMRAHRVHEYDMATRAYKRGLDLGSDSSWALYNLALTYDRLDDTAQLNAVMTTLRRLAPADADSLDVYFKALHAGSVAP
jgi:rhomboid protease GluP